MNIQNSNNQRGNVYSSNVDWENCWENDRCNSVLNDLKKSNYDLHRNEIAINQLLGQSLNKLKIH